MKIVKTWDLLAADLPRLESPFFAASKVRSLILDNNHNANKVDLERLLGRSAGSQGGGRASRYHRAALVDEVVRRIDDGELWLVYEACDGEPSDPVVCWRDAGDGAGRWVAGESRDSSELRSSLDELNRHGITPQQLAAQDIGSVGLLAAGQFDMEYRLQQREEALRQESSSHTPPTSFPAQTLQPLESSPHKDLPASKAPPEEIHLEIGIFTDGTLNNAENSRELEERVADECVAAYRRGDITKEECSYWLGLSMGGSYRNAPSNVAKLRDLYEESRSADGSGLTHRFWVYAPGIGTKTGDGDSTAGAASGLGETGIISQVADAFYRIARRVYDLELPNRIVTLSVDIFGFSRGAASARHAAHEIAQGPKGALAQAFKAQGIDWPKQVVIRFVGLFDTVAAIINPIALDLSPSNGRNDPVKVYLDPNSVQRAVHLVAADEHRKNFALNSLRNADGSLPENFREITLPGVHSDVGGGYPDKLREDVLISKYHKIDDNSLGRPEQTMQWDNLEVMRQNRLAERWIGHFTLPVRSSEKHDPRPGDLGPEVAGSLSIYKLVSDHPAPGGRIELALRMVRRVRGEYSRIPLSLMHRLAVQAGVPFQSLDPQNESTNVPTELKSIANQIMEQIDAGAERPTLDANGHDLVRQRYIHYSANYNPLKFIVNEAEITFRFGRNFSPNAPVTSGERVIHPNR